jgi:hypothetical protein
MEWTVNIRSEQWIYGVNREYVEWTVNIWSEQWIYGVNSEYKEWTVNIRSEQWIVIGKSGRKRLCARNNCKQKNVIERFLKVSYNRSQEDALFLNYIFVNNSTNFWQTYFPSSGVLILYTQQLVFVILVVLTDCLLTYSMEQSPSWEANWFCS